MRQLHLKHCQSVTISISYSYLVNRTSRRSPVAKLLQQTSAHSPREAGWSWNWEREGEGRGWKMRDGRWETGAQLSGSAAKLITMMDYNTLDRCPLPPPCCFSGLWGADLSCLAVCHLDMALRPSPRPSPRLSHVSAIYAMLSYLFWELSSGRGSEINLTAWQD